MCDSELWLNYWIEDFDRGERAEFRQRRVFVSLPVLPVTCVPPVERLFMALHSSVSS